MKQILCVVLSICSGVFFILNNQDVTSSKWTEVSYNMTNAALETNIQKANADTIEAKTIVTDLAETDITETDITETDIIKINTSLKHIGMNKKSIMYDEFDKVILDIETISQYPELPTGCEITSLTIVLNYLGFDVSKVRMAKKYLDTAEIGTASYWDAFLGDPTKEEAYGCFAPVIVEAAEEYLEGMDSDLKVYDLTGSSLEELYEEVRKGNPVIVWGSMEIDHPIYYSDSWEIDDEIIWWYAYEHCMVLSGYDLINNTVTVCDPLRDIEEYDFGAFNENYIAMESQAIVIK